MEAKRIGDIVGVAGPALFVAVFLIEGFLRPGYDPGRTPISSAAGSGSALVSPAPWPYRLM